MIFDDATMKVTFIMTIIVLSFHGGCSCARDKFGPMKARPVLATDHGNGNVTSIEKVRVCQLPLEDLSQLTPTGVTVYFLPEKYSGFHGSTANFPAMPRWGRNISTSIPPKYGFFCRARNVGEFQEYRRWHVCSDLLVAICLPCGISDGGVFYMFHTYIRS